MEKKKLVVLTGAGISAESGIRTFRDSDGLWEGYSIEEVATPEAWEESPQRVLDFYNERRRNVISAQPNAAHHALRKLEEKYDVVIITQNVDDLHERAGSSMILHLHGEILRMRSERDPSLIREIRTDIRIGDMAEDGAQFRPHIVWFGEEVPMIATAARMAEQADIFVVVGTSLLVYPAAGLHQYVRPGTPVYVIDKVIPSLSQGRGWIGIEKPATLGMEDLLELLL
jgi:NAD-dependent deacetylase